MNPGKKATLGGLVAFMPGAIPVLVVVGATVLGFRAARVIARTVREWDDSDAQKAYQIEHVRDSH